MANVIGHFRTITKHRHKVIKHCFKAGIGWQGLRHDLSKYSPTEFFNGVKYYDGTRSPNELERLDRGYSKAWLHHKGRNKHHFEYWNDYNPKIRKYAPVKMPLNYVIEMFCDNVGAGHVYNKEKWEPYMMLEYNKTQDPKRIMNKDSLNLYNFLCDKINELGEVQFVKWYKKNKKEIKKKYERGEI